MDGEAFHSAVENPYAPPAPLGEEGIAGETPFADIKKPPRVWTVFAAFIAALFGTVGLSFVGAVGIVAWYLSTGGAPSQLQRDLPTFITQPGPFIFLAGLSQLAIFLAAFIPAWLSPAPMFQRLGLTRSGLPAWQWPVLVGGGILPFAFGMFLAIAFSWYVPTDGSVESLYEQMTPWMAVPFIFFIAVAPGFNEEILFRGYMQRRLAARWGPIIAIFIASALFALLHITPHAIALAFPVGVWLGILAWRTDSTWPGIVSHATFNGLWNIYVIGSKLHYLPDPLPLWFQILFFGGAGICFIASVFLLVRQRTSRALEMQAA